MPILFFIIVGCASTEKVARRQLDFVNYSNSSLPPHPECYHVDLYFEGGPHRSYKVIGQITGLVVYDYNVRPLLEERIRQVGGDGLIDIEIGTGQRSFSSSHVQYRLNIFTGNMDQVPVTSQYSYYYSESFL